MPELPEVEVTRRGVQQRLVGARVLAVRLGLPLRWPLGIAPQALIGRTICSVGRRGKYLLLQFEDGVLLIHLGMSGSLSVRDDVPEPRLHDHFDLLTTQGLLRLNDPRRFGAVVWSDSLEDEPAHKLLAGLGMEPLDDSFDRKVFHERLQKRHAPIKLVLMGGKVVVGVGNIYASEVLFGAGIRPTVQASRLSRPRVDRLHDVVRNVLQTSVDQGGTTLRNYSSAVGEAGRFQTVAAVYGREGQPCWTCGSPIRQIRQGQRSTFFCPVCQKP